MPQLTHRMRTTTETRTEAVERKPASYSAQLGAFLAAVQRGEPSPTNIDDTVANMRVTDACYRTACLPIREATV